MTVRHAAMLVNLADRLTEPGQRDELDAALLHPARGEQALGSAADAIGRSREHDDLQTVSTIEMDMKGGTNCVAERVLHLGQPLGEVANVMIVDQGERGDARGTFADARSGDLAADEIAQHLGAGDAASLHDPVEVLEQRGLHGDAEANEGRPGVRAAHAERLYHAASRVLAVLGALVVALAALGGCTQPKASPEQCAALFEHYLDLKTATVSGALGERDAGAEIAKARAQAREEGRRDPDVVQVTSECHEQVTEREGACAMAATSVPAWNNCID